jgi:hypothetical protein
MNYHDARMARLEGRKACLDGYPRISRFRALGPDWAAYDTEWLKGYDEAAKAPDAPWFDADGLPYTCGARTKAGRTCKALVDRRGYKCHAHRDKPPRWQPQYALPFAG